MLPVILYRANDPVLCGSSEIIAFHEEEIAYQKSFFRIYTATSAGEDLLVVAIQAAGDSAMLYRIASDGTVSDGILLSEEVTPIAVDGEIALIGSGTSVVCIDIRTMKVLSRIAMNATVVRVGLAQSGTLAIAVAGDGVVHYLIK